MDNQENRVTEWDVKRVDAIAALIATLAALVVFRNAAGYFFTQDDFAALARAADLIPRFTEPWRWLSLQFYFDVMRGAAGLTPGPYHVVSLVGHAWATVLVYMLLRVFVQPVGALVGATFFAAHATHFTGVYWISTVGDIYALVFGLAALLLALRHDALRWGAIPVFVVALLNKESILLLPLLIPLLRAFGPGRDRPSWVHALRDPVFLVSAALATLYLIYFAQQNALGKEPNTVAEAAYSVGFGAHIWQNALTYGGWSANFLLPTVQGFTDAIDPPAYPWGVGLAIVLVGGASIPALRARGWWLGCAVFGAMLLPVLPLEHHTYHYYLYAPLTGLALCVAALADAVLGGPGGRRPRVAAIAAWAGALTLSAALAVNGGLLVNKIETYPFTLPGTRSEPLIDRALIAGRVIDAVRAADLPPGTTLRMLSPEAHALASSGAPGTFGPGRETYWERNVRSALYDGLAIRVFSPHVDTVQFVRAVLPGDASRVRYALYRVTGQTEIHTVAALDSMLRSRTP